MYKEGIHAILWKRFDLPGHDACRLRSRRSQWHLDGCSVFYYEGQAAKLDYHVICDAAWRTRKATVTGWVGDTIIEMRLDVDEDRNWRVNGGVCPAVRGCNDVDLNFSPSTNLLSIRRLNPAIGEEVEVRAAWLRFPEFTFDPLVQLYQRIDTKTYRYKSDGYKAELRVNEYGFVTLYPGLWEVEGVPAPV